MKTTTIHPYKEQIKSYIKSLFISESILKNRLNLEFSIMDRFSNNVSSFISTSNQVNYQKTKDIDLQKAIKELKQNHIQYISIDYDANKIVIIADNDQISTVEYIMKKYDFRPLYKS